MAKFLQRVVVANLLALTTTVALAWRDDFDSAETRLRSQVRQLEDARRTMLSANDDLNKLCPPERRSTSRPRLEPSTPAQSATSTQPQCFAIDSAELNREFDLKASDLQLEIGRLRTLRYQNELVEERYAQDLDKAYGLTQAGYSRDEIAAVVAVITATYKLQASSDQHVKELIATQGDVARAKEMLKDPVYKPLLVASAGGPVGSICNGAGACTIVSGWGALLLIFGGAVVDELSKDAPFGPNNELVKLFRWGPNNEIRRFFEFGPNNELRKLVSKPLGGRCSLVRNPFGRGC